MWFVILFSYIFFVLIDLLLTLLLRFRRGYKVRQSDLALFCLVSICMISSLVWRIRELMFHWFEFYRFIDIIMLALNPFTIMLILRCTYAAEFDIEFNPDKYKIIVINDVSSVRTSVNVLSVSVLESCSYSLLIVDLDDHVQFCNWLDQTCLLFIFFNQSMYIVIKSM